MPRNDGLIFSFSEKLRLIDAIERYEIANGELKWPALGAQNLKEARAEQIREERAGTNRQSQLSFQ